MSLTENVALFEVIIWNCVQRIVKELKENFKVIKNNKQVNAVSFKIIIK